MRTIFHKAGILAAFTFYLLNIQAQNVSISEDASYTPNPSAMLDVYSQDKGLLIPRIALLDVDNPVSETKAQGLLVWNTSTTGTYSTPGFYFWNGTDWLMVGSTSFVFGNGITQSGSNVILGGSLNQNTTIEQGDYNMTYNLNGTGKFIVQDNGAESLVVADDGNVGIGTLVPLHELHVYSNNNNTAGSDGVFIDIQNANASNGVMSGIRFQNGTTANTFKGGIFYRDSAGFGRGDMMFVNNINSNSTNVTAADARLVIKNTGNVGIGTVVPKSSALLDMEATDKGVLVPRMSTAQREAILSPVNALLVYDTDFNSFFYYNSAKAGWTNLSASVAPSNNDMEEALFAVVNSNGDTVFAVYQEGVQINVADGVGKASKGGFAVAGISSGKASGTEYLRVTPDSVRIYVEDGAGKASKGGFAVAGISSGKAIGNEYLRVTTDSIRMYVDQDPAKASKGGFAVAGISTGKGVTSEYFRVTNDSVRIYVEEGAGKASKGGFAVAGISSGKGIIGNEYLRITNDSVRIYVEDGVGKASKGGFAVAGISSGKGLKNDILKVTKDSTRIYVNNPEAGFSIGNTSSGNEERLMKLTRDNYFIGHQTGINITPSADPFIGKLNLFVGYEAGKYNTTGYGNVYLGYRSGYANTTGGQNIFLGYLAGITNSTGTTNVFVGFESGKFNQYGSDNVFIGSQSGFSNQEGLRNVFIGKTSGYTNSTGIDNVFIGHRAGLINSSGSYNVFVGERAGENNTSGQKNVFMGTTTGQNNTVGVGNVFIGNEAGKTNNDGNQNIFIGENAGSKNIGYGGGVADQGDDNIFLGANSGYNNTFGYRNTFLGTESGYSSTTGYDNVYIGTRAGYANTTGYYNTFVGFETGNKNTTGRFNSFYGYQSGYNNISGLYNSFYGYLSGYSNNYGEYNAFFGPFAGYGNTSGSGNTFLGYYSGYSNSTGDYNFFAGYESGKSNTSGNGNIFLGYKAGTLNSTGSYNSFIGYNVGIANTTGAQNTILGYNAGAANTVGSNNVLLGWAAGQVSTNGTDNTMIGTGAGAYASGSRNTYLGSYAGYGANGDNGNVFIGYQVGYSDVGSDKLMIDNSDVNSSSALIYGEFNNNILKLNADVTIGTNANAKAEFTPGDKYNGIIINHDRTSSTIFNPTISLNIDSDNTSGSDFNTYGISTNVYKDQSTAADVYGGYFYSRDYQTGTSSTRSNYGIYATAYTSSTLGTSSAYGLYASVSGNADTEYAGYFSGDLAYTGTLTDVSDKKFKQNIAPLNKVLDKLVKLNPVSYTYDTLSFKAFGLPAGKRFGLVAQELQQVFPEFVSKQVHPGFEGDADGKGKTDPVEYLGVNYIDMIPLLIQSTKEQQELIIQQNTEIEILKLKMAKIQELEQQLQELKELLKNK